MPVRAGVVALLVVALAALAWWLASFGVVESVGAAEELIQSWGPWGVAASIGLMILHSFLPFPAEVIALANGMVYGPL
ncbi:MAG: hypothetical protein EPO20_18135 [Betaproteobacteria bacterium]|nr:MAG: hypothetical protein EPO20_18135 [Betaproteobacteria bacterium]